MAFGTAIRRFESSRPSQKPQWFEALAGIDKSDTPEQTVFSVAHLSAHPVFARRITSSLADLHGGRA